MGRGWDLQGVVYSTQTTVWQPSKMLITINRQKDSRDFSPQYFSWSSRDSGSWKIWISELENKQVPMFSKNTLFRQHKTLQLSSIWKTFEILWVKSQGNLKSSKIYRQPSKVENIYRQPSKLPPHWDRLSYARKSDSWNKVLNNKIHERGFMKLLWLNFGSFIHFLYL